MGIVIQRGGGGGSNIGVNNPGNAVYVSGNEFTDGSVRFVLGDDLTDITRVERRTNGVWNLTEFEISANTLLIGRELTLSAAGSLLQTTAVEFDEEFLMPAIAKSDAGTRQPFTPTLAPTVFDVPVQPDDSAELIQTVHEFEQFQGDDQTLVYGLTFKTGSVGSTVPVVFEIIQPGLSGDVVFFRKILPADFFVANTDAFIDLRPGVESKIDTIVGMRFTSDNAFALKYNAAQTVPASTADFQIVTNVVMPTVSSPLFDNAGEMMIDNDGEIILDGAL